METINRTEKEKGFITYEEYINRSDIFNRLKENQQLIYKKSYIKMGLGFACLVVAVIPNGLGFIFYPLGFMLLINGGLNLLGEYKRIKFKVLNKLRVMGLIK